MRTVQADRAFNPANVARRLRTGHWVTAQYQEVTPAEMDDEHLENLRLFLLENAGYYAALLVIHPENDTARHRANFVPTAARAIEVLGQYEGQAKTAVACCQLFCDIRDEQARRAREAQSRLAAQSRRRPGRGVVGSRPPVIPEGTDANPTVIEMDNGDRVTISGSKITAVTAEGKKVVVNRPAPDGSEFLAPPAEVRTDGPWADGMGPFDSVDIDPWAAPWQQ